MMKYTELTGWKKHSAQKMTETYPTDERTQRINEKGLAACGAVAFLYIAGRIIYCGFKGDLAVPELVLLFVMVIVLAAVNRQNQLHELPLVLGKRLDPSPRAKGKRIGLYALNSLIYAASWTAADALIGITGWEPFALGLIADFTIGFATWFFVDFFFYERKIKRYNSYMAQLEAEENDLS